MAYLFDFWPEHSLTREEAQSLLAPHLERFAECWHYAWQEWERIPADIRAQLTTTTRAGCIQNLAISRAKILFAGVEGVDVCLELGFFKVYVGDRAVIRLKRLGANHLARNIKTNQTRRYYWHLPVRGIRDGATRLTCGYTLDVTQTRIDGIFVSLQIGLEDLIWSFPVEGEAQITSVPAQPTPPDAAPKVRAKGGPRKVQGQ